MSTPEGATPTTTPLAWGWWVRTCRGDKRRVTLYDVEVSPATWFRASTSMPTQTRRRCAYGYAAAQSVYDAVDASGRSGPRRIPICRAHGVACPGAEPEDGVVKDFGRAHDVSNTIGSDGSVMTSSDAASRTLTTVALALRQTDRIEAQRRAAAL